MWIEPKKYTFAGHDTFHCKSLWLKKGYEFVKAKGDFNAEESVVALGVGRNMVTAIRHWLRAFGIIDPETNKVTDFANFILDDKNGYDPYLEDVNTLWLLHYNLIKNCYATTYRELFVKFHKENKFFGKEQFRLYLKQKFDTGQFKGAVYNDNTLKRDIEVLLKMYVNPQSTNCEDYTSVLFDLNLIKKVENSYEFNYSTRADIDPLIFLYAVKDHAQDGATYSYAKVLELALVFSIRITDIYHIFNQLHQINENIIYDNNEGNHIITLDESQKAEDILSAYYNRNKND